MSRRCEVTGRGVQTGNNVSHANNRSRRRWLPNMQRTSFMSDILDETIKLRISSRGIRTIEKKGGLDSFLMDTADTKLGPTLQKLKRRLAEASA